MRSNATYSNADTLKAVILKDNKGKAGVYLGTNLNNGKSYVGSSTNFLLRTARFRKYYNVSFFFAEQ